MKKLLCIILALFVLCLAGCKSDKDVTSSLSGNTEIETAVQNGKFVGADYGIGADVKEVKDHYKKIVEDYEAIHMGEGAGEGHEHEHHIHDANNEDKIPYYDADPEGNYVEIDVADFRFYYESKNAEKGIVAIATDADVFGFVMGSTSKQEVEEAVGKEGVTTNATEEDKIFLAFNQDNLIIFTCTYEERAVSFYFYENLLVTAVIKTVK
ncbi:MAG: hypothetical protein IIX54_06345 [Clostridia bacterium]|nr:hypothetical protein [Clostridia bacterium]